MRCNVPASCIDEGVLPRGVILGSNPKFLIVDPIYQIITMLFSMLETGIILGPNPRALVVNPISQINTTLLSMLETGMICVVIQDMYKIRFYFILTNLLRIIVNLVS